MRRRRGNRRCGIGKRKVVKTHCCPPVMIKGVMSSLKTCSIWPRLPKCLRQDQMIPSIIDTHFSVCCAKGIFQWRRVVCTNWNVIFSGIAISGRINDWERRFVPANIVVVMGRYCMGLDWKLNVRCIWN